ncbi:Phosphorylated carbohydrates phosphatase [Poriferisphaera corsica]|uniref:Phosphorylated carbohydrates phosphatase n=1 Tax=Poriferisphaera corsica TaxID=2528020 RepID=A0A517YZD3_9BACT|nr:HAD-IA family hydrolase [Poriferisphaera corsica]QDU35559.1 Phosphorylated carbohydrates phosphatase [Poriferisphaera corsica]
MIKAIIFDMDGVLCDSEPFIIEAARMMFREKYDTEVKPLDFVPFTGTGEARFLGGVAEKYGIELDVEGDKVLTYQNYSQVIADRLEAYPGVKEFIEEVKARGIKTAVASSADTIKVKDNLNQIGLLWEDFDVVVTGSDVTRHKPDPECFVIAADGLSEKYEDCLVVEDAVAGVEAGKAAGCRVLGLTTTFNESALRGAGADWVASGLVAVHLPDVLW